MKSGKGEEMDTGKKKSMAAVICIFLIFVTLASLFLLPERKIITVRERTARFVPAFIRQSKSFGIWEQHLQ